MYMYATRNLVGAWRAMKSCHTSFCGLSLPIAAEIDGNKLFTYIRHTKRHNYNLLEIDFLKLIYIFFQYFNYISKVNIKFQNFNKKNKYVLAKKAIYLCTCGVKLIFKIIKKRYFTRQCVETVVSKWKITDQTTQKMKAIRGKATVTLASRSKGRTHKVAPRRFSRPTSVSLRGR